VTSQGSGVLLKLANMTVKDLTNSSTGIIPPDGTNNLTTTETDRRDDSAAPSHSNTRIQELDSLRALAAISLVLFHFTHVFNNKYGFTSDLGWEWSYGKYGVALFFLLSGFVNAMTLTRKKDCANFLVGRVLRICPIFWCVILLNILIAGTAPLLVSQWSTETIFANTTILPNLLGYQCMEPVTWTLQIEVLFYLILLALFSSGAFRQPALTVFVMITICSWIGVTVDQAENAGVIANWLDSLKFLKSLLIVPFLPLFCVGILLNEIKCKRGVLWQNVLGILASFFVFHLIDRHDHNPAMSVILLGLLTICAYGKCPPLRLAPMVFLSSISYALYLLHNNLGSVLIWRLNHHAGISPNVAMAIGILFSVILATVVTFGFEQPLTRYLRGRWLAYRQNLKPTLKASSLATENNG